MSLTSTRNSPASSTQTTFGRRCKDDYHDGQLYGSLYSLAFWEAESLVFRLLVFLYPWIISVVNRTIFLHTYEPSGCLGYTTCLGRSLRRRLLL
jgi:hypothetical protein